MSEIWGKITDSFDNLKKKITGATSNPTPSPFSSNYSSIQGGGKRSRSKRKRSRSGGKRSGCKQSGGKRSRSKRSRTKRKRTKKVRFSKKNKVYTYKRK